MKHFATFFKLGILVCLLSAPREGLWAQTSLLSRVVQHNNIKGQEIITRSIPYGWILTCSKSAEDGKHTFSFYSPTLGTFNYFSCHLGDLFSMSLYDFSIKDMYIFENKCYFCGTYSWVYENIGGPDGNTRAVPEGFVGYFTLFPSANISMGTEGEPQSLDDPPVLPVLTPSVDSIYLMKIPYTDSIMQIVAHHDDRDDYDVFLMAVAYASSHYPPTSTCVVELKKPVGTGDTYWKLNMVQPTCTVTDEYLTDIVLTEDHVVVASKLEYADGSLDGDTDPSHYLFRLHETKRNGFYSTLVPPYSSASVYQYDVSAYGVGIGCHHKGDAIRLCPMDGNRFCVYYHGWRHEQPSYYTGVGGPVLFWMNGSHLMEHAAKHYGFIYARTKEAAWIGDSYQTIAVLLSCTRYFPEGAVFFPTLHPVPDEYGPCLVQRIEGVDLHSIDCNPATQYLYIAGTDAAKKLWHGIQDEANYCEKIDQSCLDHNGSYFTPITPQETTGEDCQWGIITANVELFARKAKVQMVEEDPTVICTMNMNQ